MSRVEKATRQRSKNNNSIKNITKWKQYILDTMAKDDELAKLLCYQTPDCLFKEAVSEEDKYALINNQVYGYRFIPTVAEDAKSWISLSMSNFVPQEGFRQFSDGYLMGYIYFYILVDTAIMETDTGYRQDLIASKIYDLFNANTELGVGQLKLETFVENWEHNNKLGGYTMGFMTVDFK